jgi:hypothetical protein
LKLLNNILQALKNKEFVGGIFCDLEKAFVCVNHDLLMKKLKFCGIVGNVYALIKSYLSDRYQRVFIDDNITHTYTSSEWGRIKHGVPQRSILGPMFFLLYINDLPKIVNYINKPVVFADDISVIVNSSDLEKFKNDIISSFRQLDDWFKTNLLSLDYDKTQLSNVEQ